MNTLAYFAKLWWAKLAQRPTFLAGEWVRNRYASPGDGNRQLVQYLGPYLGWGDDATGWKVCEQWTARDPRQPGNLVTVAVGYFWMRVTP